MKFLCIWLTLLTLVGCSKEVAEPLNVGNPKRNIGKLPKYYQLAYGGGLSDEDIKLLRTELPYKSISLERTPCYGSCPVYRVTFFRSGRAIYTAEKYLDNLGEFHGEVDIFSYIRLCFLLDKLDFQGMEDNY
jgi:Domain of unknown function (DUF6438)